MDRETWDVTVAIDWDVFQRELEGELVRESQWECSWIRTMPLAVLKV